MAKRKYGRFLCDPLQPKLGLEAPGSILAASLSAPDKAVPANFIEGPSYGMAIFLAVEHDAISFPHTCESIHCAAHGIDPDNAPFARRAIEPSNGRAIAVLGCGRQSRHAAIFQSLFPWWNHQHILHRSPFEHP